MIEEMRFEVETLVDGLVVGDGYYGLVEDLERGGRKKKSSGDKDGKKPPLVVEKSGRRDMPRSPGPPETRSTLDQIRARNTSGLRIPDPNRVGIEASRAADQRWYDRLDPRFKDQFESPRDQAGVPPKSMPKAKSMEVKGLRGLSPYRDDDAGWDPGKGKEKSMRGGKVGKTLYPRKYGGVPPPTHLPLDEQGRGLRGLKMPQSVGERVKGEMKGQIGPGILGTAIAIAASILGSESGCRVKCAMEAARHPKYGVKVPLPPIPASVAGRRRGHN